MDGGEGGTKVGGGALVMAMMIWGLGKGEKAAAVGGSVNKERVVSSPAPLCEQIKARWSFIGIVSRPVLIEFLPL